MKIIFTFHSVLLLHLFTRTESKSGEKMNEKSSWKSEFFYFKVCLARLKGEKIIKQFEFHVFLSRKRVAENLNTNFKCKRTHARDGRARIALNFDEKLIRGWCVQKKWGHERQTFCRQKLNKFKFFLQSFVMIKVFSYQTIFCFRMNSFFSLNFIFHLSIISAVFVQKQILSIFT